MVSITLIKGQIKFAVAFCLLFLSVFSSHALQQDCIRALDTTHVNSVTKHKTGSIYLYC